MGHFETIEYGVEGGVATIWLNRPDKRNALNHTMFDELGEAASQAESDNYVRVLVLRGRGRSFCAGGDLEMLQQATRQVPSSLGIARKAAHTFAKLYEMPKPTVSVVHGHAVAGGFELMISTDFAVCSSDAQIGDFHISRALFGGGGPIYRLPRIVGMRKAKEIILTGKLLSGADAKEIGLVNASAEPEALEETVREFIEPLAAVSPVVMSVSKMALNRGLDADSTTLMTLEHLACSLVHQTNDCLEGVDAFLGKRNAVWNGS